MQQINTETYQTILAATEAANASLVAVSKTKSAEDIMQLYQLGHRDFGENYVQELLDKYEQLPKDIRWHFIGHLQRNKVKQIAHFVYLIHGVDSERLLEEIHERGKAIGRIVDVLLQVHVAQEDSKYGFSPDELGELLAKQDVHRLAWARLSGIMGIGTFTTDSAILAPEFRRLKILFDEIGKTYFDRGPAWNTLSMGMSGDYQLALKHGSTLLRVGSAIFGERD